jgi:TonB family protein
VIWNNLVAWSAQILGLVAAAQLAVSAFRIQAPRARLAYWQIVLCAGLCLPVMHPWRRDVAVANMEIRTVAEAAPAIPVVPDRFPVRQAALWIIGAGAIARAGWLCAGFWRLRRYRRHSQLMNFYEGAELRLSDQIASPVTFGVLHPVVLLPVSFPEFEPRVRSAILCHELLHVKRRDWLSAVGEELVRIAWWFHPGIWWTVAQIQLAREQVIDREVIFRTGAREEYVDTLLAMAGVRSMPDLAPASPFLRRRNQKQRILSILKESKMSHIRLVSALTASFTVLAAACWFLTDRFPIHAAPEIVADAPGVTVDLGNLILQHRTPVDYPAAAQRTGVEGPVTVEIAVDESGTVSDARVLSGPMELRSAVLESVLGWHFTRDAAGSTHQITVSFRFPAAGAGVERGAVSSPVLSGVEEPLRVRSITVAGLSEEATADLLAHLPVERGDIATPETMLKLPALVKQFDPHFHAMIAVRPWNGAQREWMVYISPVTSARSADAPKLAENSSGADPIRVGGNIQHARLIFQTPPSYPIEAKQQKIEGTVKLEVTIGKDGKVSNVKVLSGDPILVTPSVDSVRQWIYEPTLLNGNPTGVITQVDVNYTLAR